MRKSMIATASLMLVIGGVMSAKAERLMSDKKAIKEMLPGAVTTETVTKPATAEDLAAIKKELGGTLAANGHKEPDPKAFDFYFGVKDGKKTGVAVMEHQPGKWGMIGFAIGLDPATGKITNMAVTTMNEKRGRPISLRSFLKQFFGKDSKAPFQVGKDVDAVAGATISTNAAAFAAKEAAVLYKHYYLSK